ncbi:MAG: hypothetical protein FP826_04130 [Sphingomonadales bacterium]|nr:hypothetical protein [Sphingomonadales bacterium]MBU3993864.1 hypothetical protein [Alphaproteobacteria bacterium]
MRLAPQIRALLDDPAPLRRAQECHAAAFESWRTAGETAALFDAFAAFARGAPLAALPALSGLFDPAGGGAMRLAKGLVAGLLPALAAEPFGQVPVRHQTNRAVTRLMLARECDATLTLMVLDGAGLALEPPARSISFAAAEEWDVVLAGRGEGRLVERRGTASPVAHPLELLPGVALGRDAAAEALLIDAASPSLVLLRLQRRRSAEAATPVREYDLASGGLLHQSASSPRESRHEIAVALLGRMGRKDAAPLLAEIAGETARGDSLRWQALRECLGLNTLAGFRALLAVARTQGDPLAAPAGALRAQLLEHYPALAGIDQEPDHCHA